MGNLRKELAKCKHPNSRKTKALAKKAKRMNNKHKIQQGHAIKSNILGEKLSWFLQFVENRDTPLTPAEFRQLIELYLKRFDEEIEQIKLKQSISKNRANQHVARLNVITFTLEREKDEFNGGGMELLNLCDLEKLKALQKWDGNAINVQHFKLSLISRHFLSKLEKENAPNSNASEISNGNTMTIVQDGTDTGDDNREKVDDAAEKCDDGNINEVKHEKKEKKEKDEEAMICDDL